jgi:hypothetical protein
VTGLLRHCISIALVASALAVAWMVRCADAAPPPRETKSIIKLVSAGETGDTASPVNSDPAATNGGSIQQPDSSPELFPLELPPQPAEPQPMPEPPASLEDYAAEAGVEDEPPTPTESHFARLKWLGLRHSSAHGRNAGMGIPLVGTSWLNRPYYAGVNLGTVWITQPPQDNLTSDIDMFGGIYGGLDWDYYWGSELAIERATPELINEEDRDTHHGDRLMLWTASMLYYPWGDSYYRPYWRCGIGMMEIDYPADDGFRRDEALWAFPIGIGIKYPVRRWLAARAEITDKIGIGNSGVDTQHDWTLTLALEWRIGAHPRSYWPWNPGRHIW